MSDHAINPPSAKTTAGGLVAMLYGIVTYLLFLVTFLYAIAFVGNLPVPKTIDSGLPGPLDPIAGHQHRCCSACSPSSTASWRGPPSSAGGRASCRLPVERTTYVLLASLALLLLYWQWRPMPGVDLVGDRSGWRVVLAGDLLDRLGRGARSALS